MRLILAILFALPLFAANTTVTGTLLDGTATPTSGTIYINPSRDFICQGTLEIVNSEIQVLVPASGVYTVSLCPNDTGSPTTTYYNVRAVLPRNARGFTELWRVPTSVTPVGRSTVKITAPPSPSYAFSLLQLLGGGAALGDFLRWNGSNWAKFTVPTVTFTSVTSVTFTHNLGRQYPVFECYDSGNNSLEPKSVTATSTTVLTIAFDSAKSGKCTAF